MNEINNYYLERWQDTPLPLIPTDDERLNLFKEHGVRMTALAGCALPLGSLKLPAVEGLLRDALERGVFQKGDRLVEATSGRAGNALVQLARAEPYCASEVVLVMKADVPKAKSGAPQVAGATIIGPEHGLSPIATARKMGGGGWRARGWKAAEKKGVRTLNLDQYANPAAQTLYRDWAAPHAMWKPSEFEVIVAPVGTGATVCGLAAGFRRYSPRITVVGAMCASGNEIPGMRDLAGMAEIRQPWKEAIDHRVEVQRRAAFLTTPWIDWLTGIPAGPSGGATYAAACMFVHGMIAAGKLDELRDKKTGLVRVLFVVHDDVMPYVADRFMTEYPLDSFSLRTAQLPERLIFG